MITEPISPNVTKILYNNVANFLHSEINGRAFDVTCHKGGIFEFDYRFSSSTYDEMKQRLIRSIEADFKAYDKADALYSVGVSGLPNNKEIGSYRFCTMSKKLAEFLTNVITQNSVVDVIQEDKSVFNFVQVSQYFRFMRYKNGGEHFPHYDSDYHHPERNLNLVTKYSLVMYFADCETGEIAFCNDPRDNHCNSDWNHQASDEIYLKIKPKSLKVLVFPHTLCHTVLPYTQDMNKESAGRIICRGDLYFRKVQ